MASRQAEDSDITGRQPQDGGVGWLEWWHVLEAYTLNLFGEMA